MDRIVKIPLEEFINLLIDIYEKGADFIDISKGEEEDNDIIRIEVKSDYMREISLKDEDIEDLESLI
jgi:hypothetical protein